MIQRLCERFLHQISGILLISRQAISEVVRLLAIPLNKFLKIHRDYLTAHTLCRMRGLEVIRLQDCPHPDLGDNTRYFAGAGAGVTAGAAEALDFLLLLAADFLWEAFLDAFLLEVTEVFAGALGAVAPAVLSAKETPAVPKSAKDNSAASSCIFFIDYSPSYFKAANAASINNTFGG